jgi:hypothetical protein
MAPLPDGRLQLWAVDEAGKLFTRTRKATSDPNASWEAWKDFQPPDPAKVRQVVGVAHLPDGRLQLWAVDEAGKLFSTWQSTSDDPASWVKPWEDFLAEEKFRPPVPDKVRQVEVAPLPDKRLQLWAVTGAGKLFSTWKIDSGPNAHWKEDWKDFLA